MKRTHKATPKIDFKALEQDLNALRDELRNEAGPQDYEHLKKMLRWSKTCTALGYATAWLAPNPISALLLSTGNFSRWAVGAHPILHRAYDKIPGVSPKHTSKHFAKGWRRLTDWMDWIIPEAWAHEHNFHHHYRLGERHDPDQIEHNVKFMQDINFPRPLRYTASILLATTWKWIYYAPNTLNELHIKHTKIHKDLKKPWFWNKNIWLPFTQPGYQLWLKSWISYPTVHFGIIPLPFLLLGPWAYLSILSNKAMAEILTNMHSFVTIAPNHTGDDLYRFDQPMKDRKEFYARQILGSTNYTTGGDLRDFLHGWLNYQIEHHLWPDMTLLQYQKAQPRVKKICKKHGIPYVQQTIAKRFIKLLDVLVGKKTMKRWKQT